MATTTNVIQITMIDTAGQTQNFNIDNPKEGLTMGEIRNSLANVLSQGIWYSSKGSPFATVQKATITTQTKTQLENGETVTVTPAEVEFEISNEIKTVEVHLGSEDYLIGAYLSSADDNWTELYLGTVQRGEGGYFEVKGRTTRAGLKGEVTVVTPNGNVLVPITSIE